MLPKLINIEVTDERMLRGWGNLSFVEILMPDDTDDKNKKLVSETLVSRDLIEKNIQISSLSIFEYYPLFIKIEATDERVLRRW